MSEKNIQLKPSRKAWFWWYVLGILLIPLLGLGIYMIYWIHKTHKSINYTITDHSITASDSKVTEKTDLASIVKVEVRQQWTDKKFGIGDLLIHTPDKKTELLGLENPEALSEMIMKVAESERNRLQNLQKKETRPEPPQPGTMDKMDYLTGLWQQGLITNEEFEEEKKHFE